MLQRELRVSLMRNEAVDALLARQHGVVTRAQVLAAGGTNGQIAHRLASGEWIRLAGSVYGPRSAPATFERNLTAALLSRPGSFACRRSAAILHELPGFRSGRPEIVVPYGWSGRSAVATVRRSVYFDRLGWTTLKGFPVTDLPETLFMVAGIVDQPRIERLIDLALSRGRCSVDELNDIHVRHLGDRIPGIRRFERSLTTRQAAAYVPPESELERHLVHLLDHPHIPEVAYQHAAPWAPLAHRVDAYLPEWQLVVEADGRAWHTRVADFESDRERDNAATAAGIAVLRFTWSMLTKRLDHCRQLTVRAGERRAHIVRK